MGKKVNFEIISLENEIILQTIKEGDVELLRLWKNENRNAFFYDKIISPKKQLRWFKKYLYSEDDYIFTVKYKEHKIGCLGFRLLGDFIDIYNVILGNKKFGGKGLMGKASRLMYSYILDNYVKEITLKVLSGNIKAKSWYTNNGFIKVSKEDNCVIMKLDLDNFNYCKYSIKFD